MKNSFKTIPAITATSAPGTNFKFFKNPIFSHENANRNKESKADSLANPEIAGIVERLAQWKGKMLDEKQYIIHEMCVAHFCWGC